MTTRMATAEEAGALAALISLAYRVEDFFKIGDRTDPDDVRAHMETGVFLVVEDDGEDDAEADQGRERSPERAIAGCVYVTTHDDVGYFGMLSIDPTRQGKGLGSRLIGAAEAYCRNAGCREMELEVVNLRTELPPFYRRFGYIESGTRPFPETERISRPCHFIVMTKRLDAGC
jgi:GNAT superfamily N-acetyltransferase